MHAHRDQENHLPVLAHVIPVYNNAEIFDQRPGDLWTSRVLISNIIEVRLIQITPRKVTALNGYRPWEWDVPVIVRCRMGYLGMAKVIFTYCSGYAVGVRANTAFTARCTVSRKARSSYFRRFGQLMSARYTWNCSSVKLCPVARVYTWNPRWRKRAKPHDRSRACVVAAKNPN